jgi:nicotinamidase/pyrazinamidase
MNRRQFACLFPLMLATPLGLASSNKIKPGLNSALLVVDVQNCFVKGGTLPVQHGEAVVPVINRLAQLFDNVVVTQDWHTPAHISFASSHAGGQPFKTVELAYGQQILWPNHCVQGTPDADLVSSLNLPKAGLIIRKGHHQNMDSYSAFREADQKTGTGLAGYLRERKINQVFISGLATDFCVAWTAIDARSLGFDVYVIEDATRAINLNGSLEAAWKKMGSLGIHRIQSIDIAGFVQQ